MQNEPKDKETRLRIHALNRTESINQGMKNNLVILKHILF